LLRLTSGEPSSVPGGVNCRRGTEGWVPDRQESSTAHTVWPINHGLVRDESCPNVRHCSGEASIEPSQVAESKMRS